MQKIMLLAPADSAELAGKTAEDLKSLDYEVLRPGAGKETGLDTLDQADLLMVVGRRKTGLDKIARALRLERSLADLPLLVLTERKALEDFDYCLLADDFLLLPYSRAELSARIRALLWRTSKVDQSDLVRAGQLAINLSTYEVTVNGDLVDLTFKEFDLLRFLATHRGKVYTRENLLARVWGEDYYGGSRTVDVHIRRIRSKIETAGQLFVQTVRGVGYKFVG